MLSVFFYCSNFISNPSNLSFFKSLDSSKLEKLQTFQQIEILINSSHQNLQPFAKMLCRLRSIQRVVRRVNFRSYSVGVDIEKASVSEREFSVDLELVVSIKHFIQIFSVA